MFVLFSRKLDQRNFPWLDYHKTTSQLSCESDFKEDAPPDKFRIQDRKDGFPGCYICFLRGPHRWRRAPPDRENETYCVNLIIPYVSPSWANTGFKHIPHIMIVIFTNDPGCQVSPALLRN